MKHLVTTIPLVVLALSNWSVAAAEEKALFASNFDTELAQQWKMIGGNWELDEGCLKQTEPKPEDPTKAVLVVGDVDDVSSEMVSLARLRLDSWQDGGGAWAGGRVCS